MQFVQMIKTSVFSKLAPLYFLLLFLMFQLVFPAQSAAEVIKIGGTGAGLGLMKELSVAFARAHPVEKITVMPSMGSSGGIKAVQAGVLDIAISSRPLEAAEASLLIAHTIGKTPFVLATHKSCKYNNISTRQLVDFYSGTESNWSNGEPLRLVLRPPKEIDNAMLAQFSPDMEKAVVTAREKKGMLVAFTDQDAADALEKQAGSLGTSTLSLLLSEKRAITPLAYNGVKPSIKSMQDGSYPYAKQLFLVTQSNPGEVAGKFIAFMRSPAGRKILNDNGVLPAAH